MRIQGRATSFSCIIVILSLLLASCESKRSRSAGVSPAAAIPVSARQLPPLPVRPLSANLQAMRERTMRVASDLRELKWTSEVGMTELSGWDYGTRTREMAEIFGGDDLRALSKLAAAGNILPEGTDLATLAASFTAVSAGATYSPLDKQVLLISKFSNDSLLTHEFVHALQDQNFDLMKLLEVRPYEFDRTEAVFAIVEGDAMNVQRRAEEGEAYSRRTLDEIARREDERFAEYRREVGALFPKLLTETFIFRYRDGERFIEAVRRNRGQRGVDELFRRPPLSSEQILHPEKYNQGEAPRDVRLDEAAFAANGWRSVSSTSFGEIGVRGLLLDGVSVRDAVRAASGWGGDRAYLFERVNSAPLFVWKSVWDKQSDAEEFFRAYNSLERQRGSTEINKAAIKDHASAQTLWHEAGRATLVRLDGDSVIIIRGADDAINAALELAQH